MSSWPHLLSLSLANNDELTNYSFGHATRCFPSLTSLTSPNCSNQAIDHFVQLPKLEELCFPEYSTQEEGGGRVRTTMRGFRALGKAASLRSIQYWPPEGGDEETPNLKELTHICSPTHLTRLTLSALWLTEDVCVQLLSQHLFVHLRCLELIPQYGCGYNFCPQTDNTLLPLVKPAHFLIPGRVERQSARAAKRGERRTGVG